MQDCNDAWISVGSILLLPKLKIFHSLVLLVKLVCQFSFKNYVWGCNYSAAASSNQEIDFGFSNIFFL